MYKILLIEDDLDIRNTVSYTHLIIAIAKTT